MQFSTNNNHTLLKILSLSSLIVSCLFLWQGHKGFNLWDEGFLWYGAQRVIMGEVPIRDFMSYDPGRYYWSALLMRIFGDNGIMSLRITVALFQTLGLSAGLLSITRSIKNRSTENLLFLLISALILVLWMFPRHKLFDISLSLFLIAALAFLAEKQTARRYFISGVCVGLVAVFGRNHGVYGAAASFGILLWLHLKRFVSPSFTKGFMLWTVGIVVGFTPVLLMLIFVPGFASAFWQSICFLFEHKATNLPLPVPWPWHVNFNLPLGDIVHSLLIGLFFITLLIFGVLAILWVIRQKLQDKAVPPTLVASAFLTLPYAHFAYSRADIGHLAQGIFPVLVGFLVLLSNQTIKIKWPFAVLLCTASCWVMYPCHPGWQCAINKQWVNIEISENNLKIDPYTANDITLLRDLTKKYTPEGQAFIATPFWPGAYPLLQRKAPMWEIYALFPRSNLFENKEIERIKTAFPRFALILDIPLDGHDALRFRNTHPLIHQYILEHFEPVSGSLNPAYQLYKIKNLE